MNHTIDLLLFGVFPYVALAVAVVGCFWRINSAPLTWKTGSSQMLESRILRIGSILFHLGMVNLALGHLFGLLTPHQVYEAFGLTTAMKQKLEIAMGFLMTPVAAIGCAILIWRRIVDPRVRAASSWGDMVLLSCLLFQLVLGFLTIPFSLQHLDGSMMLRITGYTRGLAMLDPGASQGLAEVPWIYKAHMLAGFGFLFSLPFTRLVHVLSGALALRFLARPWQVVRRGVWSHR